MENLKGNFFRKLKNKCIEKLTSAEILKSRIMSLNKEKSAKNLESRIMSMNKEKSAKNLKSRIMSLNKEKSAKNLKSRITIYNKEKNIKNIEKNIKNIEKNIKNIEKRIMSSNKEKNNKNLRSINVGEKNSKKIKMAVVRKKSIELLAIFAIIFLIIFQDNFAIALSKYGSSGTEVIEIQKKLKNWGYYTGSVDGIYGSKTVSAVKKFQKNNGLTADGVAGSKTLAALGITSSSGTNSTSSNGNSNSTSNGSSSNTSNSSTLGNSNDLNQLARVVYAEARGEVYTGQVAIAAVVLNRVKNSSFPNTISGVIYQSGAFTSVADGQINLTPDSTAKKAAQDALNGWDPTYGCIYYFNPNTATSSWIWSRPYVITIGKHRFCK